MEPLKSPPEVPLMLVFSRTVDYDVFKVYSEKPIWSFGECSVN